MWGELLLLLPKLLLLQQPLLASSHAFGLGKLKITIVLSFLSGLCSDSQAKIERRQLSAAAAVAMHDYRGLFVIVFTTLLMLSVCLDWFWPETRFAVLDYAENE